MKFTVEVLLREGRLMEQVMFKPPEDELPVDELDDMVAQRGSGGVLLTARMSATFVRFTQFC